MDDGADSPLLPPRHPGPGFPQGDGYGMALEDVLPLSQVGPPREDDPLLQVVEDGACGPRLLPPLGHPHISLRRDLFDGARRPGIFRVETVGIKRHVRLEGHDIPLEGHGFPCAVGRQAVGGDLHRLPAPLRPPRPARPPPRLPPRGPRAYREGQEEEEKKHRPSRKSPPERAGAPSFLPHVLTLAFPEPAWFGG